MADRTPIPRGLDLEEAFRDLAEILDYPPTPPLAQQVRIRLTARPARRRSFWDLLRPMQRPVLVVLLVLIALAGIGLGLFPNARSAVAERLGLRGVTITRVPANPSVPNSPSGSPVGAGLRLGQPVTLEQAQREAGFTLVQPHVSNLGAPDEVYLNSTNAGPEASFVYHSAPGRPPSTRPDVGLLFMQFQAQLATFIQKGVGPDTKVEQLTVNGGPGFWLEGQPHAFFYQQPNGQVGSPEDFRLATNTLVWEQNGLTLRLEGPVTKDEAVGIAASVK